MREDGWAGWASPDGTVADGGDAPSPAIDQMAIAEGLDLSFYRRFYADISRLTEEQLYAHWSTSGRVEGRYSSWSAVVDTHPDYQRLLPDDFSVAGYRLYNPDLKEMEQDWEYIRHFIDYGLAEGRQYQLSPGSFIADAYFNGQMPSQAELADFIKTQEDSSFSRSMESMLESHGVTASKFLSIFDAYYYSLGYPEFCGAPVARMVRHFLEQGIRSLTPVAAGWEFDFEFYSEYEPGPEGEDAAAAYLRWLNDGLPRQLVPNAAALLKDLGFERLDEFPSGFDPEEYLAANKDLGRLTRWRAIEHAVVCGIPEHRPACELSLETLEMHVACANRLARGAQDALAERIFTHVLAIDQNHTVAIRHIADSQFRQGKFASAARSYRNAIFQKKDTVWSFLNLASCFEALGNGEAALDTLCELHDRHPGDEGVRQRKLNCAASCFADLSGKGGWFASRKMFSQATSSMVAAVRCLEKAHRAALATTPTINSAGFQGRRASILAELSLPQCKLYRVESLQHQFKLIGVEAEIFDKDKDCERFRASLPFCDMAIFYRIPALPDTVAAIAAARAAGIPTFYDIDDPIFDPEIFPDTIESYGGLVGDAEYGGLVTGVPLYRAAMAMCGTVVASTEALAARAGRMVSSSGIAVHANVLPPRMADVPPCPPRGDHQVRLFYGSGTKGHNEDFELFAAPAIGRILAEFGNVELAIVGYLSIPESLRSFKDRVIQVAPCWDFATYWRLLATADVNLAVLKPGPVADCKSGIKWLEAGSLGIPTVATDTAVYRGLIRDGVTGLLARNPSDWYDALVSLVQDQDLRSRVGSAARQEILTKHTASAATLRLSRIFEPASRGATEKMRVLIVNVFYPPQAIGGATRVVADNVRELMSLYGQDIEVEIFTTTEGGVVPYEIRSTWQEGIRVTAVTADNAADVDSRPEDERMGAIFGAVLDRLKPDVVHFHCIQRLSASICGVTRSKSIPYFITLHDGWWISSNQFLVDQKGRLTIYNRADPLLELRRGQCAVSLERSTKLLPHLINAAGLLAVSEPFAELHRAFGLTNVIAVDNGLPPLVAQRRTASIEGQVRILYAGGACIHKGYMLIQAAISRGSFPNLELRIIDHSMPPGVEATDRWGKTRIRLHGKYPQSEVGRLYAETDVLLAPSVWPESYGLVAREAAAAGCWVIASDRGAIGRDVTDATGFKIDVSSILGLQQVLDRINRNPNVYTKPVKADPLRKSIAQATELMRLYLRAYGKTVIQKRGPVRNGRSTKLARLGA